MSKNITGTDFYLEAGINHFGKDKHAKKILNYFLKSKFSNLTFMLHNENFYKTYLKKGIDFSLSNNLSLSASITIIFNNLSLSNPDLNP